jgi:hypothetical protein
MLNQYVQLRIAYAGAAEWKDVDKVRMLDSELMRMERQHPELENEFKTWFDECAKKSNVAGADDDMAKLIRKHFSGKRVNI